MLQGDLETARDLLQQKRYAEAREILENLDDPTAQKWLIKLDTITSKPAVPADSALQPTKQKNEDIQKKLVAARRLIEQKRYAEARIALQKIKHPTATKWLAKLDALTAPPLAPQPTTTTPPVLVIKQNDKGPGCVVQLLWFIFIGWWATQLWVGIAWFFLLTIIGIPLSIFMINRVSNVIALRPSARKTQTRITTQDGISVVETDVDVQQINIFVRIIWFVLFGIWLSALWMEIAFFFCLTLIGLPLGLWMFDRTPKILTLRR